MIATAQHGLNGTATEIPRDRSSALDATKGVLIALVVLGHVLQFFVYRDDAFFSDPLFKWIYMWHMPLFVAITGYLSYGAITRAKSALDYVPKRFRQLIVPVLLWAGIKLAILFSGHAAPAGGLMGDVRYVTGSYWYLWMVFVAGSLVCLMRLAKKDSWPWLLALSVLLLALPDQTRYTTWLLQVKFEFPFFALGYTAFKERDRWTAPNRWYFAVLSVAFAVCFALWTKSTYIYTTGLSLRYGPLGQYAFRWVASAIAAGWALWACLWMFKGRDNALLARIGKQSLAIYLMQEVFFEAGAKFGLFARFPAAFEARYLVAPALAVLMLTIPLGLLALFKKAKPGPRAAYGG